jgi:hypothetical protein
VRLPEQRHGAGHRSKGAGLTARAEAWGAATGAKARGGDLGREGERRRREGWIHTEEKEMTRGVALSCPSHKNKYTKYRSCLVDLILRNTIMMLTDLKIVISNENYG